MEIKSFKKQTAEVADEVLRFQDNTIKRLEQQVEVNKHLLDMVHEHRQVIIKLINQVNELKGEENKNDKQEI